MESVVMFSEREIQRERDVEEREIHRKYSKADWLPILDKLMPD
jgi:hypothetical protein